MGIQEETRLVTLGHTHRLLSKAKTIEQVKIVRDKAKAVSVFLKERGVTLLIQNEAAELKVRTERKLGQMLTEMPKHPPGPDRLLEARDLPPKLRDLGIEQTQSHARSDDDLSNDGLQRTDIETTFGSGLTLNTHHAAGVA